jgi:release factor glutamine methyltransferase
MSAKVDKSPRYFIDYASLRLKEAQIDNYRKEAEIIASEAFGLSSVELYLEEYKPRAREIKILESILDKRCGHMPLAYILNKASFFGREFYVDENVLVPRPETEILVESVIKFFSSSNLCSKTVVDIGTGCGNVAISLTKHLSSCKIMATDICPKALEVARRNIEKFGLEANIVLLQGNLFEPLKAYKGSIDVIVSNPPYIGRTEMQKLSPEVKKEPHLSLYAAEKGLDYYQRLLSEGFYYLSKDSYMFLEVGYNQKDKVEEISLRSDKFELIDVIRDYRGFERVLIFKKKQDLWIK